MVPMSSGCVEFSEHIWIFWNRKLKSTNLREFQVCAFPLDFGCCFFPPIRKFWYMVVSIFGTGKSSIRSLKSSYWGVFSGLEPMKLGHSWKLTEAILGFRVTQTVGTCANRYWTHFWTIEYNNNNNNNSNSYHLLNSMKYAITLFMLFHIQQNFISFITL